jgi:GNAT superfamily N-acetyltransferase
VGICGCWIATKFYCGKYLEIDNFIIHPNHQRKGYGRYFLLFIERLAREENCETIMLDAFLDNKKAHDFYKSEGYEPKGYHFLKVIGHKAP